MIPNLEKYKADLDALLDRGRELHNALQSECLPNEYRAYLTKEFGDKEKVDKLIHDLPSFTGTYQSWYSEAKALIRQLLPDRLEDFVRYYEKPKSRKELTNESYRIEDCLQGISRTSSGWEKTKIVGPDAALPHFRQQIAILKAVKRRFESSLFDIRQLAQADLLDSELDEAEELIRKGFTRAAGAIAGVVLERHLAQVCENHAIKVTRKNTTIADFNDALKGSGVIDTPEWRSIQLLGDLRNLCDHDKKTEPHKEQVSDLINGVKKVTKTLF
jgi:hypothetical protein